MTSHPSSFLPPPSKKILKAISLELRHLLEGYYDSDGKWQPGDLEQRLAAIGVRRDREPVPVDELAHLSDDDKNARTVVDAYLQLRDEADVSREEAVAEFVRETAYTWANRLLCLRCMEARELIDEVILQKEAYGGRSLEHHRLAQREPEVCSGEDDGLFAVLDKVFTDQSEHLPLLFDPQSPGVALRPSPAVLKRCLALLSGNEAVRSQEPATGEVFQAPDALGWAYQYWNTEEKDRVFEKVRTKKSKISGADIIPATQLYTEPYMVKFLVQNSLGATWMGMHPDSKLYEKWEYYVRDADRAPVEKKPVAEITFLDPACGSGHFLTEAFDLYNDMYVEEGELTEPEDICRSILEKNLFGIDIDARSVQIAEAAMWMKAAERAFDFPGAATNLVAAVASHLKGDLWEEFLAGFEREPSVARVLQKFGQAMEYIDELGSLARPAEELQTIIHEEHTTWERQVREQEEANFLFPEMTEDALSGQLPFQEVSDEEFGERLLYRVRAAIDGFTVKAREEEVLQDQLLGEETAGGFRLLALLATRYDVVVANPPYMSKRTLGRQIAMHLKTNYSIAATDLYTAFLLRCFQLSKPNGVAALITMNSYLTIASYAELREFFLSETHVVLCWDLGPFAFEELTDHVKAAMVVVQKTTPLPESAIRFAALKKVEHKASCLVSPEYQVKKRQSILRQLPGAPWAYAVSDQFIEKFGELDALGTCITTPSPCQTGKDDRFVRKWWEVPPRQFGRDSSRNRWIIYTMGGLFEKWHRRVNEMVDWSSGARAHFHANKTSRITADPDWFKAGITYTTPCTTTFNARILEGGAVYDRTGPAVFPTSDGETGWLLAYLNSKLAAFLLKKLNETLSYQAGNLKSLPLPRFRLQQKQALTSLAEECVASKRRIDSLFENSHEFETASLGVSSFAMLAEKRWNTPILEYVKIMGNEYAIEAIVNDGFGVDSGNAENIQDVEGLHPAALPEVASLQDDSLKQVHEDLGKHSSESLCGLGGHWCRTPFERVCFEYAVPPGQLAARLDSRRAVGSPVVQEWSSSTVTVQALRLLGHRWPKQIEAGEPVAEWVDPDGIIPLTEGTDESTLLDRVRERMAAEFEGGDVASVEREFAEIMGKPLEQWLSMEFFKHHTKQFKKRPIAWQIQSSKFTARKKPAFACLVYYHKLDGDLLPKIRNQYVGPLRSRLETELRSIESVSADTRSDRQQGRRGELEDQIDELRDFDATLQKVISEGFASKELTKIVKDEPLDKWCSLDGTRPEPESQEALLQQDSRYFPDINDGVRVNIAPLQKAGLLAADVLAKKDLDKAIADRAQWRADERRWCRENKLPQPGWWKDEGGGMKDEGGRRRDEG